MPRKLVHEITKHAELVLAIGLLAGFWNIGILAFWWMTILHDRDRA